MQSIELKVQHVNNFCFVKISPCNYLSCLPRNYNLKLSAVQRQDYYFEDTLYEINSNEPVRCAQSCENYGTTGDIM